MQYAYPLLAIFIWAGNTVVNKLAVGSIFPAEIGFYRWLFAALLFTPFMLKPVVAHWPQIRPNLGKIFILGVLGMAVYQSLAYYAATLTSATNMGIILSLMPLMALTAAIISLADACEAACRSLDKPSAARIEALVDAIFLKRFHDGQLINADMTLAELEKVRESFINTLLSMKHGRIAYHPENPKKDDGDKEDEDDLFVAAGKQNQAKS